ncbi:lactonase family protein [Chitinophagaceae bacterium LB-8]|uniref:Lactonase family protein n=1 Tax=Paraflavisolibacter caeni TaxID=2982496 RepID=A0A9X3BJN6_9BACT|nr:lactonase family protein [Paraflavisolibacter caeni]MCU7551453.1 lactonase family protein [Paraflavisolibacter caeni]
MKLRFIIPFLLLSLNSMAQSFHLFIGTYTGTGSKGVYVYRFHSGNGDVEAISSTDSLDNPSYLAIAPGGKYIYAVNEVDVRDTGFISAFAFDPVSGKLTFLNRQPTGGVHPCYVAIDQTGKWVLAGNYTGGSLSLLPVNNDGSLLPPGQTIQHTGSSVNKQRQEKAHVHSTVFSPDDKFVFTPDLGMDKVMIYRFDPKAKAMLKPAAQPFAASVAGSGPRHFTFHPNKKYAYLIEEMSGTVVAYGYKDGKLSFLQRIATHPADYKGAIGSADIHISPDGKFLYASNRGDENTITIFSVDGKTGKLQLKGYQSTLGKTPRNFMIDPTGHYLLVANQETNNIVIFKRDQQTGLLQPTGKQIEIPKPVCLKMSAIK